MRAKELKARLLVNSGMANLSVCCVVTTLKSFKVWTQHRSKGKPLKETNGQLDVDLTYRLESLGTSHGKVKHHLARSLAPSLTNQHIIAPI